MRVRTVLIAACGLATLAACSKKPVTPLPPPPPPGAVAGSSAADRDGDGIVDGYYTSDGIYHPYAPPAPPPPPPAPTRRGERG
ncbi:hypothetical protein KZ813_01830 [Sphingomonas sp. RHCKR7]|uniref:hypothetical protein n=1 Tax=Sphingomonas folli TaxID=2862497 RepID=UPI001CA47230|nr:hypothetical protein [Sphingomonas folli]MBW6525573.1 hypothetical protein [Sphingomonas folli]